MDHKMKMVRHEAPGYGRAVGREKPLVQGEKDQVIFSGKEYLLPVIALVINVINVIGCEWHITPCFSWGVFMDKAGRRPSDPDWWRV